MELSASLLRQLDSPNLSLNQRAELRCQIAKGYEDVGQLEAARQAMGELWQRIGERPAIEGLERSTAAEALLGAGVLTSWIGSCHQIPDAQETAKNLISESITIFESLDYGKKILEGQSELAVCYWREGRYDEARIILREALSHLSRDSELKARTIMRSAIVECSAARYKDALHILTETASLFERVNSHLIKGSYHNQLAIVLKNLVSTGGH